MFARLTLSLIALLLLAGSCTTMAGGEFIMPIWRPQFTNTTFGVDGTRAASVSVNWRTGQGPFTVDIEMPDGFEQIAPLNTPDREVVLSDLSFLLPEGTSGIHTYTATIRVTDALGQVNETTVDADFDFPAM